jgi:hypothetical protein
MSILISLLIVVVVVAVCIWIVNQIPFPAGLGIVKTILIAIICILGLMKVLGYL